MNWYQSLKLASFINEVQISEHGKDWITLWINGKKYEYKHLTPKEVKDSIHALKVFQHDPAKIKSLGRDLSKLIRSLDSHRVR